MLAALIQSMRPKQWVKNAFVMAPLVFSARLLALKPLMLALGATLCFCLLSGAVYLMNDVFDVERDRLHPTKRHRPVASGRLPVGVARWSAVFVALASLAGAFAMDPYVGVVAVAYLLLNVLYSWKVKHVVFLDVVFIALGFLLRTLAGALVIDVSFSVWLFGCTFLIAMYLGLGKRKHEMLLVGLGKGKPRRVLDSYRLEFVNYALLCCAGLTTAAYTAYTLSAGLPDQPWHPIRTPLSSPWLPLTIPFAVVGLVRFYFLISKAAEAESPTDRMIQDPVFVTNLGAWGLILLVLIYT